MKLGWRHEIGTWECDEPRGTPKYLDEQEQHFKYLPNVWSPTACTAILWDQSWSYRGPSTEKEVNTLLN